MYRQPSADSADSHLQGAVTAIGPCLLQPARFFFYFRTCRYATSQTVQPLIGHTQLHRIVVVWHGMEMAVCEEC